MKNRHQSLTHRFQDIGYLGNQRKGGGGEGWALSIAFYFLRETSETNYSILMASVFFYVIVYMFETVYSLKESKRKVLLRSWYPRLLLQRTQFLDQKHWYTLDICSKGDLMIFPRQGESEIFTSSLGGPCAHHSGRSRGRCAQSFLIITGLQRKEDTRDPAHDGKTHK